MPKTALERARIRAGLSQEAVAEQIGVAQSTYQRYESGKLPIPKTRAAKIQEALGCSEAEAHCVSPVMYGLPGVPEDFGYYGEVVVHLSDGSKPILLPVSVGEANRLENRLHQENQFLIIESLDNRIMFFAKRFIADVVLSDEAVDQSGPETDYDDSVPFMNFSDSDFWDHIEILEELSLTGELYEDDVDLLRLAKVAAGIGLDVRGWDDFDEVEEAAWPAIYPADFVENPKRTDLYFAMVRGIRYKVCGRPERHVDVDIEDMEGLVTELEEGMMENWIRVPAEYEPKWHYINTEQLIYLVVPKNKMERHQLEMAEA